MLFTMKTPQQSTLNTTVLRGSLGFLFSFCFVFVFPFKDEWNEEELSGGVQVQNHVAREILLFLTGPLCFLC